MFSIILCKKHACVHKHLYFRGIGSEPIQQRRVKICLQSTVNSMTKCVKRKPNLAILEGGIFWNKGLFWKLCQITWLNKNNRQCICIKPSCCFCYLVMNCFLYMMLMTLTNWKHGICWVQSPGEKRDYFNLSQFRVQPLLDRVHIFVQTRYSLWLSGRAKPTGTWRVQIHDFGLVRPAFKHTEIIIYRNHWISQMWSLTKRQD